MSDFEPIDFTSIDDIPGINAKSLVLLGTEQNRVP